MPRGGGGWFEASAYAEGEEPFREQLSTALGASLRFGLANSTDFASRILWPPALTDRPLFTFSRVTGPGYLRRLKLSVLPEISRTLSPDALSAIQPGS